MKRYSRIIVVFMLIALIMTGCTGGGGVPTPSSYGVSGKVTDKEDNGISDVVLNFSGGFGVATSDSAGRWSKDGLTGSVSITPVKDGWNFETKQVTKAASSVNFAGTKVTATYPLIVAIEGEGRVEKDVVVSALSSDYEHGTQVKLTAVPETGWRFSHWEGDLEGSVNPATVAVDRAKTVIAVFVKLEYALTITVEGEGIVNQEVFVSPQIVGYEHGTQLQLTAVPATGWHFSHWEGDFEGYATPAIILMDSTKEITAVFNPTWFAGGSGTQDDPYLVADASQLNMVRDHTDKHFLQINDIDLGVYPSWTPIGTWYGDGYSENEPFTGGYDGNTYSIINMAIDRQDVAYTGLFAAVGKHGVIKDVKLKDICVKGGDYVGGVTGLSEGTLSRIKIAGTIIGIDYTGAIAGRNHGLIIDCFGFAEVNGRQVVGGLVGTNYGEITRSSSEGYIEGENMVGGLVGDNNREESIIDSCSFIGEVVATGNWRPSSIPHLKGIAGGLVGDNYLGSITASYSSGYVGGMTEVGGLVGLTYGGVINNSHSTSDVECIEWTNWSEFDIGIGGLVGLSRYGEIRNSYATGDARGEKYVGGLVGHDFWGILVNSYSTGNVIGHFAVGGLIGRGFYDYNSTAIDIGHCHSTGNVIGENSVGGLVGTLANANLLNSYTTGTVQGSVNVGGLIGSGGGEVTGCYSVGSVEGEENTGGLVGIGGGRISNSFAKGNVNGANKSGGLVGCLEYSVVENCYAVGKVAGGVGLGGLVGIKIESEVENGFYDQEMTGRNDTGKGIPRTTAEMMQRTTFIGWDFDRVWDIRDGIDYPYLRW